MNKRSNEDIYNVNKYSDSELFQILDLINPSDRELEAKIIYFLNKYQLIKNESGKQLYNFFNEIYDHFFESSSDKEDGENEDDIIENIEGPSNTLIDIGNPTNSNMVVANTIDPTTEYRRDDVKLTKTLDYSKDKLNPLLKQTIRRIISIDSSYRPNQKDLATDFTFNLSDPLRDVLSLKLYSVQIPYTWYTISKQYGSNFFYFKGNSIGIDNGDHDYKFEIKPGNYTPTNLIDAINTSITNVKSAYTDVSFGTTSISYNSYTSASTFTVDITKVYNETRYYLYFPTWVSPNEENIRNQTIPSFLGYNYQTYNLSTIYSKPNLPLTETSINDDNTNSVYTITSNNRYFTIKQYQGYDEYNAEKSTVLFSYHISFNQSTIVNGGQYSRNALYNDLSNVLLTNPYLTNSSIQRIDVSNQSLNGYNKSFYKMNIQLNPMKTPNIKNSKTIVIFQTESGDNTIWTGTTSCFLFDSLKVELNNMYSETYTSQTNYVIGDSNLDNPINPYMYLKCINPEYSYIGYTGNDYNITIPNSSISGYTLDEYLAVLNTSITNNDFNMTNTSIVSNSETNSKIRFRFDINKKFTQVNYTVDFTDTSLKKTLKFSNDDIDLSNNNIITSTFDSAASYTIDSTDTTDPTDPTDIYLIKIIPIRDGTTAASGNKYAKQYNVAPIYKTNKTYTTLQSMEDDINSAFILFRDDDDQQVLSGTTIKFQRNTSDPDNPNQIDSTLTIKVQKTLSQKDYKLSFYKKLSDGTDTVYTNWTDTTNSWYNYLKIEQQTYNLVDYVVQNTSYSDVYGLTAIFGDEIEIDNLNNRFYLKPLSTSNGVYTSNDENDIIFDIDEGSYTRSELIDKINTAFSNNPLTIGSSISIFTNDEVDYTKLRININKIFTANDYRLVFYDPYSFVKCYVGSSSIKNSTWDSTIGWVLGFRSLTEYTLSKDNEQSDPNDSTITYYNDTSSYYSSNSTTNIVSITGDTAVCTNLYNYFLIVLDDFNQSHLNDGLVTITNSETDIPLPSYANRSIIECNPVTGETVFSGKVNNNGNNLTQKELYATNEKLNSRKNKVKSYSNGPFVKDIFGLIPMKTSGLSNGAVYVEFGGTLQNQDRTYFGPVNIHRMSIKLMNERGDVVDLNNANWSFSLMCEQLYQQQSV